MEKIFEYFNIKSSDFVLALINVAFIIALFIVLFKAINAGFERVEKEIVQHDQSANVGPLRFFKYLSIIVISIVCISSVVSYFPAVDKMFTSLLASSGVIALIISVASQDAISNIVSGVFLIFLRPFKIGDVVKYVDKGTLGVVEEISLRHTVIRTFENNRLIIPNKTMNSSIIENYNYADSRACIPLEIDITFESDVEKAMGIYADVIKSHPLFKSYGDSGNKPKSTTVPKIIITSFDSTGVTLRGWLWADSMLSAMDYKSDVLRELRLRFKESGICFAYPHVVVMPPAETDNNDA